MDKKYKDNVFTKIINKEINASIVFENETLICFKDVNPRAKVHVLVVPKKKVIDFDDFIRNSNESEIGYFFNKVEYIAKEILKLQDYKIQINKGVAAGQELFHFHVHILGGFEINKG